MSTINNAPKSLKVYACGGAATNLVSKFGKAANQEAAGFAKMVPCYIDTSRSNIDPATPDSDVYLFEGLDGSGKQRKENYEVISERQLEILQKFKPAEANVVIHSTGGGSGSTIGPVLVSELLKREENVFVVLVGSTGSLIETENTLKTLQSYENIAKKRDRPVVAFYRENSQETTRGEVDKQVFFNMVLLSALFSGQNRELDTKDLANFLNYPAVTNHEARLVGLEVFSKDITMKNGEVLMSVASLVDDNTPPEHKALAEYQATGRMPDALREAVKVELPLHACTIAGYYNSVAKRLQDRINEFAEYRKASVVKSIAPSSVSSGSDGLVL